MDERSPARLTVAEAPTDDDALLPALRAGDAEAAEILVRTHAPWMLSVARRILRDGGLAEDSVQEAFIQAFRGLAGFEGRSSLRSWLHRILVNQALSKLRSRKRRREEPIDELLPDFDATSCRVEAARPAPAAPDEILAQKDRRALVREMIERLPESYRIVLQLRDIEELSTEEVAAALELTTANVKVRLHRARAALKKLLEPLLAGDL